MTQMQDSTTPAIAAPHTNGHGASAATAVVGHADGHASGAGHSPHLAHHFDTPKQQYESAKLGMWLFLATEILMFSGLFCAYAVYRANHPDVFTVAHGWLDMKMGAINTVVLIASSFTMAWAVRAAQTSQKRLLVWLLAVTLLGGVGFMVIKGLEYQAKWQHMVWVGEANAFYPTQSSDVRDQALALHGHGHTGDAAHAADVHAGAVDAGHAANSEAALPVQSSIADAAVAPAGLRPGALDEVSAAAGTGHGKTYEDLAPADQERLHLFFQIYFLMTGLHGIHVLIGMGLILYILVRSVKGHFSAAYFTPVDIIGLYWHLVDLIWIFLFPLLYLIH